MSPRVGVIPFAWLNVADTWSAAELLDLRDAVDQRGIDETDLAAVAAVWEELHETD